MLRVFPGSDAQQVTDTAFLIWHLGEATMRLAISCALDEGRQLVEAFKRMSLGEIMAPATVPSAHSTFSPSNTYFSVHFPPPVSQSILACGRFSTL